MMWVSMVMSQAALMRELEIRCQPQDPVRAFLANLILIRQMYQSLIRWD